MNGLHTLSSRVLMVAALCLPLTAGAISVGHIDDFEDGTTQNWAVGLLGAQHPAPPANVLGGPAGATDNFLKLTAVDTQGAGNRLAVINFNGQWAGDYRGIAGIRMSVRNFQSTDLSLRLYLENPVAGPPTDDAISSEAFELAANSGWVEAFFPLVPSALTVLNGDLDTLLQNVTALRILHADSAAFPPSRIVGVLGVDNIRAVDAPATSWLLLMLAGLSMGPLALHRRR